MWEGLQSVAAPGFASLFGNLALEPLVAERVRITVAGFSDDVIEYMHLEDLRGDVAIPKPSSRGSTSYAAAFGYLRLRVSQDVSSLKELGHQVYRPIAFFITDGYPNPGDNWRAALKTLLREDEYPRIVAFGLPGSSLELLRMIAYRPELAFVGDETLNLATVLRRFFEDLTASIVQSTMAAIDGKPDLIVPLPSGEAALDNDDFV